MTTSLMSPSAASHSGASAAQGREILSFSLGDEEYGVDIQKVQELRGYDNVTRIANAPPHLKGVMNLRGIIVPIIDMRLKFKLAQATYDEFTVVIVLNIDSRVVGMVVDGVSDVTTLEASQIKPPPALGTLPAADYLTGIGALDERMLLLVDIDRLLAPDEPALAQATLH
jgi:purine-binding chemotaxis protein CheW